MKWKKLFSKWKLFARQARRIALAISFWVVCLATFPIRAFCEWTRCFSTASCASANRKWMLSSCEKGQCATSFKHLFIHTIQSNCNRHLFDIMLCLRDIPFVVICPLNWSSTHRNGETRIWNMRSRERIFFARTRTIASFVSLWWWVRQRVRAHDESTAINNRNEKIIQTNKFRF